MSAVQGGIPNEGSAETVEPIDAKELLLNRSLYDSVPFSSVQNLSSVKRTLRGGFRMDGHCPDCRRETTFTSDQTVTVVDWVPGNPSIFTARLKCARDPGHLLIFWLLFADGGVQKIGQYPSLADIANDEAKQYARILDQQDEREFHRAIGLAAHGVGIGAFVYLRRVVERLVDRTFLRHKSEHGVEPEQFQRLRFVEKIDALKDFLPDFLVGNKYIYRLLSLGIHELDEKDCLAAFSVMRAAIVEILEDETRAREKAERRAARLSTSSIS